MRGGDAVFEALMRASRCSGTAALVSDLPPFPHTQNLSLPHTPTHTTHASITAQTPARLRTQ